MDGGNRLLQAFAQNLVNLAGKDNTFRFLGDRFVMLTDGPKEYVALISSLNSYLRTNFSIKTTEVKLSACICGIPHPYHFGSSSQLIDFMDYAVGKAKACGSGTFIEADRKIVNEYLRRKEIESFIYTAVKEDLFEVYYQPIWSDEENKFISAEALARLKHPTLGMISPAEFIPIAESSGEISKLEKCILKKVCFFVEQNPSITDSIKSIKVNLSPVNFLNANLGEKMLALLAEYNIPNGFIEFEITETASTVYVKEATEWANIMKNAGIGLCLDDFGSGYANLDAVLKLPFNVIKIDRSMLTEASANSQQAILYQNIVTTIRKLGFAIIAEGAQTKEDVKFLKDLGIRYIQVFYYSLPLSQEDFLKSLPI